MPGSENKFLGLYEGTVTKREGENDETLGRVKVRIPGLIEPESANWAEPIGVPGGGHSKRGHYEPPAVGSNVEVMFVMGSLTKPRYFAGPWGAPEGVIDTPEGAAVEGENRQNAVTEDEEWTIQRDSRSSSKKYLVKHKSSELAVLIDATAGKIYIISESADQAMVRGTEYRTEEASLFSTLQTHFTTLGTELNKAGIDATLVSLAPIAATALVAAGVAATSAGTAIGSSDIKTASAFLSTKAFME